MYKQEDADKEYQEFVDYMESLKKRAAELPPFHEDNVTFLRLDMKKLSSALFSDSETRAKKDNVRLSWYGMVLSVCPFEHFDPFLEEKKKRLKPGDVFLFNPEVAYSLNIEGYYEIWTLSLQNIMNIDKSMIDVYKIYKDTLQKRVDLFKARL